MIKDDNTRNGGAHDRGSADRYYGRPFRPHKYSGATYKSQRIDLTDADEIAAYAAGYDEETDRKNWE